MKFIRLSSIALLTTLLPSSAYSFSPSQKPYTPSSVNADLSSTRLQYRDLSDVDDSVLASPPRGVDSSTQFKIDEGDTVLSVKSIQDYLDHVVNEDEKITILRFSAPWCRVRGTHLLNAVILDYLPYTAV